MLRENRLALLSTRRAERVPLLSGTMALGKGFWKRQVQFDEQLHQQQQKETEGGESDSDNEKFGSRRQKLKLLKLLTLSKLLTLMENSDEEWQQPDACELSSDGSDDVGKVPHQEGGGLFCAVCAESRIWSVCAG
eukprot:3837140-Rhodomonas_salina.3